MTKENKLMILDDCTDKEPFVTVDDLIHYLELHRGKKLTVHADPDYDQLHCIEVQPYEDNVTLMILNWENEDFSEGKWVNSAKVNAIGKRIEEDN